MINNTQNYSYSSIGDLKNASINTQNLPQHGRLQVGGKNYNVQIATGGEFVVARQSGEKKNFFNAATELFSHRLLQGSTSSRSKQIANVLNEKRTANERGGPVLPAWVTPGRTEETPKVSARSTLPFYATPPRGIAGTSGVKRNVLSNNNDDFKSLLAFTKGIYKEKNLALDFQMAGEDIYRLIVKQKPHEVKPLDEPQQEALLDAIIKMQIEHEDKLLICSQASDDFGPIPLSTYIEVNKESNRPQAMKAPIRIESMEPDPSDNSDTARLTINVRSEHVESLARAIADTMVEGNAHTAKLMGPKEQGNRTESAILYLPVHYERASEIARSLTEKLPPDAFVNHTPVGMHPVMPGFAYAELSGKQPDANASYGKSRTSIINEAISKTFEKEYKGLSLENRLQAVLKKYGYNPTNPAFLASSSLPGDTGN